MGDVLRWIVVGAACVAAIGFVVWFIAARRHPEQAASHGPGSKAGPVARRPAGPDAEDMAP